MLEMKHYRNLLRRLLGNAVTLLALVVLLVVIASAASRPRESQLQVHFLSVGQGDAELIQTPDNRNILIDGGPDGSVLRELGKQIPFYDRKIDALVLTHPHADHVSGLVSVLKTYQVGRVYLSGVIYTTPEYLSFLEIVKQKQIETKAVKAGDSLDVGNDISLSFLFPLSSQAGSSAENVNNTSVVTRLVYGAKAVLFMGDLEAEGQAVLLASGQKLQSDIYKVPHHGSKDSINIDFLGAVAPKIAVIEVGRDNKFGHPTADALRALGGVQLFRTDKDGTVSFAIDRERVWAIR